MGKIEILADGVADQIAAGEVVERPASVVKELVENALDSGATRISVECEAGGRTLIRVVDDGCGMHQDDAVLAVERHATSKIRTAADLVGVPSYGFRGEALPAIASVSRLELETAERSRESSAADSGSSTRVVVSGGRLEGVEPTAHQPGTSVTVQGLFFNVPARRKFLRSPRSETRAITQVVTTLALARLDVSFTVTSDGRTLLDAPSVSVVAERIASLFGRRTAEQLVPVEGSTRPVSVRGFIQRPADARPSGRKAFLYVNGRPFRDPFLIRAAEAGYRATISPGCRPTMFLTLSVPGDGVDVNVHPAKLEVRFRDRYLVEQAVERAVRDALRPIDAAAVVGAWPVSAAHSDGSPPSGSVDAPAGMALSFPFAEHGGDLRLGVPEHTAYLQAFDTYVFFETSDGIAIVDQHSAHERVLFEQIMGQLTGQGAAAQRLLLPIVVDLAPEEAEALETHRDLILRVGYEVEGFGGRSVALHAVPNPHPRFDARRCFEEMVADLTGGRFGALANRMERFAATFACRAAIKAGQKLARDEIRELMVRLMACELPPHDVHGRPSMVQLPRGELERRFGRS